MAKVQPIEHLIDQAELIQRTAEATGLDLLLVAHAYDGLMAQMQQALVDGEGVRLAEYFTVYPYVDHPRPVGFGGVMETRGSIRFRSSQKLRDAIHAGYRRRCFGTKASELLADSE